MATRKPLSRNRRTRARLRRTRGARATASDQLQILQLIASFVRDEVAPTTKSQFVRSRRRPMGQIYLQRFVYSAGVTKAALDQAWGEGFKAFAQTGNWGGVDSGVTHHQTYGTG